MIRRIFAYLTILLAGVALALGGLLIYWSLQPSNILDIKNDPLPVRPLEVSANGGIVIATVDYCKTRKVDGHAKVYLVGEGNGQKPELAWPVDTQGPQCLKIDIPIPIPASTQTDVYHIVFEVTYKVNPLKDQVAVFRTRSFKVINEKLQPGDAKPVPVQ